MGIMTKSQATGTRVGLRYDSTAAAPTWHPVDGGATLPLWPVDTPTTRHSDPVSCLSGHVVTGNGYTYRG